MLKANPFLPFPNLGFNQVEYSDGIKNTELQIFVSYLSKIVKKMSVLLAEI